MSKLYPPIIAGTLPAFYGNIISIPFEMNRGVSKAEVNSFYLKIKTAQSNSLIDVISSTDSCENIIKNKKATFNISHLIDGESKKMMLGQYYKVQMAYRGLDGIVGPYSSLGVIKYTTAPDLIIEDLDYTKNNNHKYVYEGIYSQADKEQDSSEKLYSYQYILYDNNYNIIQASPDIIHNSSENDEPNYSHFSFKINQDLDAKKKYYLRLKVITSNKMEIYSKYYPIIQSHTINSDAKIKLEVDAFSELENGGIKINMVGEINKNTGLEETVVGSFKLMRSDEKTNYSEWEDILNFDLYDQTPTQTLYIDYTIEQGVNYKYALIQYNKFGLFSNRIESEKVFSNFEHMYLYDGEKQLAIKYNPKVASFKETVMEQKTNTIGSKYPFIFKNGNVGSKEFSISGLISLQMDETFLFTNINKNVQNNLYRSKTPDIKLDTYLKNYEAYNMQAERDFKLEVLDWLNNGEPKLFRSAAEGNYIVRLINTSLSPNDQLARRLHTFSSTACEIDEVTFEKLKFYNLLPKIDITKKSIGWMTVDFAKSGIYNWNNILKYKAKALRFENMIPGDKIFIDDGIARNLNNPAETGFTITIGATGYYELDLDSNIEVSKVEFRSNSMDNIDDQDKMSRHQGQLTYAYDITAFNKFDTIKEFEIIDVPAQQFFGPNDGNIFDQINNIKEQVQKIYYIHAILLPENSNETKPTLDDTSFYIDGKQINLSQTKEFLVFDLNIIPEIKNIGKNILIELGYQKSNCTYEAELELAERADYINSLEELNNNDSNTSIDTVKEKYQTFLNVLESALKEQELIKGELV